MPVRKALLGLLLLTLTVSVMPMWLPRIAQFWNELGDRATTPEYRQWAQCMQVNQQQSLAALRSAQQGAMTLATDRLHTEPRPADCGPEPRMFAWSIR